ncbi:MAG: hypothetical protein NWE91_06155 [Candidatus Bathyarchaeota archaeon]|nr:hypothetical protein [Candidatus Bathyarchaeota archaeon]
MKFNDYSLVQEVKCIIQENCNGGERASREYLECHNKEIWENGKSQLHRKKAFLEEKLLSLEGTIILAGISVNPNNRLKIGTTGDISICDSSDRKIRCIVEVVSKRAIFW